MKKNVLISISFLLLFLFSCKDDNKTENNDLITISGITELNIQGMSIGTVDTTDWRLDDKWLTTIEDLFKRKSVSEKKSEQGVITVKYFMVKAYPNPTTDVINFDFGLAPNSYCDLRIVDSRLNIIFSCDSLSTLIRFDLSSSQYKNKMFRSYYKIYNNDIIYRGHGDIKIN